MKKQYILKCSYTHCDILNNGSTVTGTKEELYDFVKTHYGEGNMGYFDILPCDYKEYITQDILDVKQGIIVQQVNCRGVMGAGLAKQIRQVYPQVYTDYMKACSKYTSEQLLGNTQLIKITDKLTICNLFAQLNYGTHKIQTDYRAFKECLEILAINTDYNTPIYIPYKIGCGLAGGDWEVIKELINKILCNHNVIICKKED